MDVRSLAGRWGLALDPDDQGVPKEWYRQRFAGEIDLPGSLDVQGIGDSVDLETEWTGTIFDRSFYEAKAYAPYRLQENFKIPFCLQPETRFVGAAWYQKAFEVPGHWSGKAVRLYLERLHWRARVWLDDVETGKTDSLSTGAEFELGKLEVGRTYWLTIRVDNRLKIPVGENAHSISDHTQGNWNGMVGRIELLATEGGGFEFLEIHSEVEKRAIVVRGRIEGAALGKDLRFDVKRLQDVDGGASDCFVSQTIEPKGDGVFEVEIPLGSKAALWDEFHPVLYELEAICGNVRRREMFGLRDFSVSGTQFCINGTKTFLRGALDCCIFPLTGHPPMDVEAWRTVLGRIKEHGFNHVRFHSWCPPEAAFQAGDELGLYFQVECAVWPNSEAVLAFNSPEGIGDGKEVDEWVYREGERILRAYGNHACFVMMACGNEPGGPHHESFLSDWVERFQKRDPRRLYTGTAGWPELEANHFQVIPEPRIHQWGDGLDCRLNGSPPATTHDYRGSVEKRRVPIVAHENGQWCAYPPVYDTAKYTGHLKAKSYELFSGELAASGMADQAAAFVKASGKLQALCYKEEIESALRTPGLGGFQLLGLQDFPGQGTAPVGLLDAFWEGKGYLTAEEMRRFCGDVVVLARLQKRVFASIEPLEADIEVAHFGPRDWTHAELRWKLVSASGNLVAEDRVDCPRLERGSLSSVGRVVCPLDAVPAPSRCRLLVEVADREQVARNDWDIWVYGDLSAKPESGRTVLVSNIADGIGALEKGERVLLVANGQLAGRDIALGFTPIFWNTACTQRQAPHTLGILCDPEHPALRAFPSDSHTDWQWWFTLKGATPIDLGCLAGKVEPIVQVIDDWYSNRHLGLLWEATLGNGRLLVCGADLLDVKDCMVRKQLLHSLLRYMQSSEFEPQASLERDELLRLNAESFA